MAEKVVKDQQKAENAEEKQADAKQVSSSPEKASDVTAEKTGN